MAKAGEIVINISAGTAQMILDMEKVKGSIRSVGSQAQSTFSARYALFGFKDLAEGRYRFAAAELVNELTRLKGAMLGVGLAGVGIGVLAFAFLELGNMIQKARDKATEAFRSMNEPLQKTNDELDLSSAKLDNEFARLSHKPVNRIAEALIEGRIAADDLAESLDKDLEKMKKVMEESRSTIWMKFVGMMGHDTASNDATNITREINEITARGITAVRNAGSGLAPKEQLKAQAAAQLAVNKEADDKYNAYAVAAAIRLSKDIKASRDHMEPVSTRNPALGEVYVGARDTRADQARERALIEQYALQKSFIGKEGVNNEKKLRNEGMGDQKAAAEEQLKQDQKELDALKRDHELIIGEEGGFWAERILNYHNGAGAWEDAFLSVSNKIATASQQEDKRRQAERGRDFQLQEDEFSRQLKKVQERAEVLGEDPATAGLKLAQETIASPSASEGASKVAHDKLLELTKASNAAITAELRKSLKEQDDAYEKSGMHTSQEIQKRAGTISLWLELLRPFFKGIDDLQDEQSRKWEEAGKKIDEQADKLAKIRIESKEQTDIGANTAQKLALEQQYAQYRSHSQQEELSNAKAMGQLEAKTLQDKLVKAQADHAAAEASLDAATRQEKIAQTQLEIDNAQRAVDQQRLQLAIQITTIESEHAKTLKEGLDRFIHDANAAMKTPGDILKDGLTSALDQTSDNLTKMMTGQKAKWSDEFKSIGRDMLKESIKSELTKGLGALGIKTGKPDGTKSNPIYTVDANGNAAKNGQVLPGMVGVTGPSQGGSGGGATPGGSTPGVFGGSQGGSPIFHALDGVNPLSLMRNFRDLKDLKSLFPSSGMGASGGMGDSNPFADQLATDFPGDGMDFPALAGGGDVDPGNSYWVGDGGDGSGKELFSPKTAGTVTPASKVGGGGDTYHIDNRGAELGSENRLHAVLKSVHASSVSDAVRATRENSRRTPRNRHV
jgi:hypothetical protein